MELSSVHNQIIEPITQEAIKALKDMAHSNAWAGAEFQDSVWKFRFNGFAIVAEVSGMLNGTVVFHHYLETAMALGKRLLNFRKGSINEGVGLTDEMQAALLDYADEVVAHASKELKKTGMQVDFKSSFPVLSMHHVSDLLINVDEIHSIPLHVDTVGRHYLNFFIKDHNGMN